MKRALYINQLIFVALWMMVPAALDAASGLLSMKPGDTVAIVNGEEITAMDMFSILEMKHGEMKDDVQTGKVDYSEILDRIIKTRLIVQEARAIGFNELQEFRDNVKSFRDQMLISRFLEERLKDLKVDDSEVEREYRGTVKEWKTTSYLMSNKEDAEAMIEEIRGGKPIETVGERFVSEGKAEKGDADKYMKDKDLLPEILQTVSSLAPGEVSSVIPIQSGFVVLRVDDKRAYEDAAIREKVAEEVRARQRKAKTTELYENLVKKYVTVNEEVLGALTYDSKESIEKAINDDRIVAEIKGDAPITVGELTDKVKKRFFHGLKSEQTLMRADQKKAEVLEDLLKKRVFIKEALAEGVDKGDDFRYAVQDNEHSLLFGYFLQKVVVPEIKINDEELHKYYDDHIEDYTYPEMMGVHSLAYVTRSDAEYVIEQLHKGTDFRWIKENSKGQVTDDTKGLLHFGGDLLLVRTLPGDMQQTVSGARPGSYKFYAGPEDIYYVLYIEDVRPPSPQPIAQVREDIFKILFNEKVIKSIEKWADQLRKASEIKILINM